MATQTENSQGHGENWRFAFRCCFAWACGYIVMWASKWGIAALILGVDTLGDAMQQASIHLSIEQGMTGLQSMCETLRRNIFCLLPLDMGIKVSVITGVAVIIIMAIHIKRKTIRLRRPTGNVWLYLFLGLLPYLRFIVIRHHSWFHYFFTYRAQAASILALCFAVMEIVEMRRRPTHTVPQTIRHLIC